MYNSELWSEAEDKILKDNYPSLGSDVAPMIPGRTLGAIRSRAIRLKLRCNKPPIVGPEWTDTELGILLRNYGKMGSKVAALIPGRTEDGCRHEAAKYGLQSDAYIKSQRKHLPGRYRCRWTDDEIRILKENYSTLGGDCYTMLPGRTRDAVYNMARKFDIRYTGGPKPKR